MGFSRTMSKKSSTVILSWWKWCIRYRKYHFPPDGTIALRCLGNLGMEAQHIRETQNWRVTRDLRFCVIWTPFPNLWHKVAQPRSPPFTSSAHAFMILNWNLPFSPLGPRRHTTPWSLPPAASSPRHKTPGFCPSSRGHAFCTPYQPHKASCNLLDSDRCGVKSQLHHHGWPPGSQFTPQNSHFLFYKVKAIAATYCKVVLKEMKHISTLPIVYKHLINANPCHHYCDYFRGEQESIQGPEAMENRLRGGSCRPTWGRPSTGEVSPHLLPKGYSVNKLLYWAESPLGTLWSWRVCSSIQISFRFC